jgi:hypothetical protein
MKNLAQNLELVANTKTIKGTSFDGIANKTNPQGGVSNQTIVAGITYKKCLVNDFNSLQAKQNEVFETLQKEFSLEIITKAYTNLLTSLEKRLSSEEVKEELRRQNDITIKLSDAQKDAYLHIAKGVKLHIETQKLHIFGLVVRKKVVKAIEYKETKSRELTIVQNKIKKLCEFKQDKYRIFIFDKAEVKLKGITI